VCASPPFGILWERLHVRDWGSWCSPERRLSEFKPRDLWKLVDSATVFSPIVVPLIGWVVIRSNLFRSPKRIPCCCKSLPGTVCMVCHCLPCHRVLPSSNQWSWGSASSSKHPQAYVYQRVVLSVNVIRVILHPLGGDCVSVDSTQLIHSSKKKLRGFTIIRSLVILCLCDWRPASRQLLSNSMHLIHTDECCIYPAMQESTTNRNIYSDVANKKHADHIHICRLQCSHLHLCIDVCRDIQNYHIHQLQTSMDKILALPELPTMCTVYSNFCWVCLSSFWIKAFFSSSGSALNMKTDLSPMSSLTMRNRMKLSDLIEEAKL
jgi:hypothetical protein